MADEKPSKGDAKPGAENAADAQAKPKGKGKLIGIVTGVMILEGVGIFAATKMLGADPQKSKAEPIKVEKKAAETIEEIEIAQIRAPNAKEGRPVLWSLQVAVRVSMMESKEHEADEKKSEKPEGEKEGEGKDDKKPKESPAMKKIKMNERTLKDRLARIVRSAEPQYLQEDGLETLKRQIKHELERVLGEEFKIVEVLVPECTPYPTGF